MLQKHIFVYTILYLFLLSTVFAQKPQAKSQEKTQLLSVEDNDGDYLLAIEKVGEVLQTASIDAEFTVDVFLTFSDIKDAVQDLQIILKSVQSPHLNVRNQQMYLTVLEQLKTRIAKQCDIIDRQDSTQNAIQQRLVALSKDKMINILTKDTLRQKQFKKELAELSTRYKKTATLLSENAKLLTEKKREILENETAIFYALQTVEDRLQKMKIALIKTEYPSLWNSEIATKSNQPSLGLKEVTTVEKTVNLYYFNHIRGGLILFTFLLLALVLYVRGNLNYIRKKGYFENLEKLNFKFLNRAVALPILLIGIYIILLSNLYAPAVFTTLLYFVLLLSIYFLQKGWQRNNHHTWIFLIVLFTVFSLINLFVPISLIERYIFIAINVAAIYFIIKQLKDTGNTLFNSLFFRKAGYIFIFLCSASILFNIFGRMSLAHNISLTATIALTQVIALRVLIKIIIEIILLQIYRIRVQRGLFKIFDQESLTSNLKTPFIVVAIYIWIVVTTASLNLWSGIENSLSALLHYPLHIGNFTFSLDNILLFFTLIWLAHLLQKYVAYFFGEIDDEDEDNLNKKQHSRLLIIRLVVVIGAYLLAVLASGMPLDRISIIIGALGVGVGLGLQGIVSNFVSGVILIFDRSIQIGDIIELSSQAGRVKSMDLRTTKINASNGSEIIIPNSNLLSQNITNWTYTDNRKQVEITLTIKGELSTEQINQLIRQAIKDNLLVDQSKPCQIYYNALAKESYGVLIRFWCSIYRTDEVLSTTRLNLYQYFGNHGTEITI